MTIEQIKAEIERDLDLAIMRKHHLLISSLPRILKMLNNLEPSWHEYPKEKPPKDGEYIVTVPFEGAEQVAYAEFEQGRWILPTFCYNCLGYADTPIAWKEKDKPYKKEDE